ncbi:NAD(P)-dependent oxidoreductase [Micractinium conductrix]|uniref:NAD(P)-dependent oxidoreductase n=1 Tax=Micractinium conductrix TaxID=554055 RepID=A0A2P6VAU0_9CHLO|nr:NAD(P)-dependent oxidoreductase [Micractinium conductrix]|eukprot:PSC71219.1 NAD(P)-dependent oxidoreductase [Micractinium conductrix]
MSVPPAAPPPYQAYSIAGQTALVTGASSGIGEACAWRFAEAGCKLVLVARRAERLAALQQAIQQHYNVPVHTIVLDVQDLEAIARLPAELPAEFREVDILLPNAGLALGVASVHELDMQDAATMINTNVLSVMALVRAFTPSMVVRNRGHLLFMSSIAGREAYSGGGGYCASKHALEAFATSARHDLVGTNIRVTSIQPGAVKTEFSVVRFKGDGSKADAVYEGIHPLLAADIADNTLYACTRPPHVQVAEMLVFATYQCSAKVIARVLKE